MSIQAATIQADVVANIDQAVKTLVDFDAQLQALANNGNTSVTITAKTDQAQAQIAALGNAAGQAAPVTITPELRPDEAERNINALIDYIGLTQESS